MYRYGPPRVVFKDIAQKHFIAARGGPEDGERGVAGVGQHGMAQAGNGEDRETSVGAQKGIDVTGGGESV